MCKCLVDDIWSSGSEQHHYWRAAKWLCCGKRKMKATYHTEQEKMRQTVHRTENNCFPRRWLMETQSHTKLVRMMSLCYNSYRKALEDRFYKKRWRLFIFQSFGVCHLNSCINKYLFLIKMFHDMKKFSSNFLKSQHPFQVRRVPNGFLDTLAFLWHRKAEKEE